MSTHRRPRGRDRRDRAPSPTRCAADRRGPPAPAGLLGGQGRRRARLQPRAARGGGRAARARRSTVHRFEQLWREGDRVELEIECSSGTYVRSLVADLGDAYCEALRRTAIGPFRVEDADGSTIVALERRARLPARASAGRATTPAAPRTGSPSRATADGPTSGSLDDARPDRDRRAAGGRRAQARRRLPRVVKVTPLPDAEPRPAPRRRRRVRRRPPRPPRGDRGQRHRADLRPASARGDPRPTPRPSCSRRSTRKAELVDGAGRRGDGRHPVRREFAARERRRTSSTDVLVERLGADARLGRAQLPLRPQGGGRRRAARGRRALRDHACHELVEVEGEIVSSSHIRGLVLGGRGRARQRVSSGAPFQVRGEVVHGDRRGRELGFPTANLVPDERLVRPGHGVYAALADGRPGRRERRRAPDVRDRPRRADRGLPDRLRRRPLRPRAAHRLPRSGCAASSCFASVER